MCKAPHKQQYLLVTILSWAHLLPLSICLRFSGTRCRCGNSEPIILYILSKAAVVEIFGRCSRDRWVRVQPWSLEESAFGKSGFYIRDPLCQARVICISCGVIVRFFLQQQRSCYWCNNSPIMHVKWLFSCIWLQCYLILFMRVPCIIYAFGRLSYVPVFNNRFKQAMYHAVCIKFVYLDLNMGSLT